MSWPADRIKILLAILSLAGSGLAVLGAVTYSNMERRITAVESDHDVLIEVRNDVKWIKERLK